jgi:hypothetical protein
MLLMLCFAMLICFLLFLTIHAFPITFGLNFVCNWLPCLENRALFYVSKLFFFIYNLSFISYGLRSLDKSHIFSKNYWTRRR